MRIRITVSMSLLLMLLILSSCGLFSSQQEINTEDAVSTFVAETLAVMNAAETIAAQTLAVTEETEETVITVEEATPVPPTETPTDLPTATLASSATLSVPMVQVSVNTNCRTGPGAIYDWVSALLVGQEAEVVARNADGSYWVIPNPGGAGTCWLWGFYATVEGPTAGLPVWDAPPTPTPLPTNTFTPTPTNTLTPTISYTTAPSTYKTGPLEITQTYWADLDEGVITANAAAVEMVFEVVSSTQKYLTPLGTARMAIWGSSAPGMYDCIGASLSQNKIPLGSAPVGTYICYQTNQGRPGVFRVNELTSGPTQVIKIGFTTWNAP